MIKNTLILLLLFQFNWGFGQKSLQWVVSELENDEAFTLSYNFLGSLDEIKGISIQNEPQILRELGLERLDNCHYFITGQWEINTLKILFISKFLHEEVSHFAFLLDQSLNVIDRLERQDCKNDAGYHCTAIYVDYNILSTTSYQSNRTPNYTEIKYSITRDGFKPLVDQIVIDVPSGCRVFQEPTRNSVTLTWAKQWETFDYLDQDYHLDSTITSDGNYLKDNWFEVAIKDSHDRFGYVFGGFAKRQILFTTNDYNVIIDDISEEEFRSEEIRRTKEPEVDKISDADEIEKLLKKNVTVEYNEEYQYRQIKRIVADNGEEIDNYWEECGISAYFPAYHYLLLECGHASDYLIDLKNGDDNIGRIGNLEYYLPSPDGTFHLNGYYSGQGNVHFLEKKNDKGEIEYLFDFSSLLSLDFIETYFWISDNTLIAKIERDHYRIEIQVK